MSLATENPQYVPESPVKADFEFFLKHLPALLESHRGKWLVISGKKFKGATALEERFVRAFAEEMEAVDFAFATLWSGEFIIQECVEEELCMVRFHSPVVL